MSEMPGDWRRNRRDAAKKRASRKERLPGEDARTHVTFPVDFRGSCRETVKYRPICLRRGFQRKRPRIKQIGRYLSVYPVPICARAPNSRIPGELNQRGHHDWPDKRPSRKLVLASRLVL